MEKYYPKLRGFSFKIFNYIYEEAIRILLAPTHLNMFKQNQIFK